MPSRLIRATAAAALRPELVGDHDRGAGLPVPAGQHRGPAVRLGVLGGLPERRRGRRGRARRTGPGGRR